MKEKLEKVIEEAKSTYAWHVVMGLIEPDNDSQFLAQTIIDNFEIKEKDKEI